MTWQEYQDAVAELYEQSERLGAVSRNIFMPDKITGQKRQIDVWWVIEFQNHRVKILIDAKSRKTKIDVKDVEEILALAESVNADKAIIVTNEGWTKPAKKKAEFCRLDLRLFTFDEATDILHPDKWLMCPECNKDCIFLDESGFHPYPEDSDNFGLIFWWLGGKCRTCKCLVIFCQECGGYLSIPKDRNEVCICNIKWSNSDLGMSFDVLKDVDNEFECDEEEGTRIYDSRQQNLFDK